MASKLKINNYFREVSIVMIGIILTFSGSALISYFIEKKDIKNVMWLVREELNDNLISMEKFIDTYKKDSILFSYFLVNQNNIPTIPIDSLRKIQVAFYSLHNLQYKKDAFELMKSSSLLQNVRDREISLTIIEAYDLLARFQQLSQDYKIYKNQFHKEFHSITTEQYSEILNNIHEFFYYIKNSTALLSFFRSASVFFGNGVNSYYKELLQAIEIIDKKYKFDNN